MKLPDWDAYFFSRYRPISSDWGVADLQYYEAWYAPWIRYITTRSTVSFSGKSVLEIGCGIGAVSSLLDKLGAKVTGTDVSPMMLKAAKRVSPQIQFSYFDVRKSIKNKIKYDMVVGFEVLEHIDKIDSALKNIRTLLKKGGVFMGTTPYPYSKNMEDPTHVHVDYPHIWKERFLQSGFRSVQMYPLSCPPLLWRIHPALHIIIPRYVPWVTFISTTVVVAYNH